ncbi:ABC transporter ATP-binding protein [Oenococcus oeni]|uniref:ABC transporter ATP-binding protein n=1 Tax=Oenococcus oeni TaxID=1247 RepID=UPI00050F0104|nr:ABC transporter ATP-binding protein [Oenococcus oeni]KGO16063.1 spermidine/putrescine ABC transporter ATP-binding protein [Oenococcus oeni X2L]KGH79952.1 spermidine/putrescine ABC transporter ATP-binding protein [Oenococcus oeni IOEB_0607]KGH88644.1 spermidine/putrescine ABC transporter ATP-binding protein [Oenococcus oeni IOEB_L26_1]KMQ38660.1 spermidine/putrescine ABC transporter ATP-binding protein [Oenococcus oeni]OIK60703.1 spermidine/putrescine ABC transporter ATP-binding protein [Oen
MARLDVKHLAVSYNGKNKILNDINLTIEDGELVSLLGPSGCGKTTTLRSIAGLIRSNQGQILVDGKDISRIPVYKRNFGMVFQSYALFPQLTVRENVAFGLKNQHIREPDLSSRVNEMLDIVGLLDYAARFPSQLSGGQQQRVSLARSLVTHPSLLLLDEPLSNLDAKLRVEMREMIREIQQRLKLTMLFVTHDQSECFAISDHVAVMNKGVIEQFDSSESIYHHPLTEFVAHFIGYENFFQVKKFLKNQKYLLDHNLEFTAADSSPNVISLTIRPEDIEIIEKETENSDNHNQLEGKILFSTYLGDSYRYQIDTPLRIVIAVSGTDKKYLSGQSIVLNFPSQKVLGLSK